MKISKINKENKPVSTSTVTSATKCADSRYQDPVDKIYAAIQSLGKMANDDVLAREAIADLSVVMLDLKSGN